MNKILSSCLAAVTLALGAHHAKAAVVVGNLDVPRGYAPFTAYQIGQSTLISNTPISLTSVQIMQSLGNTTANETFAVYLRNANGTVGNLQNGSFSLAYDATALITTATATSAFTLQANTGYFFVLTANSGTVDWDASGATNYGAMYGVSVPDQSTAFARATMTSATNYYNITAEFQKFQVNGTATTSTVPDAGSTLLLMILGAGSLLAAQRSIRVMA